MATPFNASSAPPSTAPAGQEFSSRGRRRGTQNFSPEERRSVQWLVARYVETHGRRPSSPSFWADVSRRHLPNRTPEALRSLYWRMHLATPRETPTNMFSDDARVLQTLSAAQDSFARFSGLVARQGDLLRTIACELNQVATALAKVAAWARLQAPQ
jgi:hypothetical protein